MVIIIISDTYIILVVGPACFCVLYHQANGQRRSRGALSPVDDRTGIWTQAACGSWDKELTHSTQGLSPRSFITFLSRVHWWKQMRRVAFFQRKSIVCVCTSDVPQTCLRKAAFRPTLSTAHALPHFVSTKIQRGRDQNAHFREEKTETQEDEPRDGGHTVRQGHSRSSACKSQLLTQLCISALRLQGKGQAQSGSKGGEFRSAPLTHPPARPSLSGCSCLRVFPRGRPEAHNGPSVLHLLQVIQADVLVQLNHFVHPENVSHPMIGEDNNVEVVLQLPLLWVDKASQDSAFEGHTLVKSCEEVFKLHVIGERRLNRFWI